MWHINVNSQWAQGLPHQTKVCPYLFPKHCAVSDLEEEIMDSEKEGGGREGRLKKIAIKNIFLFSASHFSQWFMLLPHIIHLSALLK